MKKYDFEAALKLADTKEKLTALYDQTKEEVMKIDMALLVPKDQRVGPSTFVMDDAAYDVWRMKAGYAKAAKQRQLTMMKNRIKELNRAQHDPKARNLDTVDGLLKTTEAFLGHLAGVCELEPDEIDKSNAIRAAIGIYFEKKSFGEHDVQLAAGHG